MRSIKIVTHLITCLLDDLQEHLVILEVDHDVLTLPPDLLHPTVPLLTDALHVPLLLLVAALLLGLLVFLELLLYLLQAH